MTVRTIPTLTLALALLAFAGCDDSSTNPPPVGGDTWIAQLVAEGDFEITGSATAEVDDDGAVVTIEIENGTEGEARSWFIGTGAACGGADLRMGEASDYPDLEPDEAGEASAEATLDETLDPEEAYHVAVFTLDEEEELVLVACGELELEA